MKKKFWIKTRVFLWFWFFVIVAINIVLYILYLWFEKTYIWSIKEKIWQNYEIVKNIIEKKNWEKISISETELENIKNLWFFIYFWKKSDKIEQNYKLWYFIYWENLVFRWDYKWNNILIWKNIFDFLSYKSKVLEIMILADLIWFFIIITMIYFITNKLLKPLIELSKIISNYDIIKEKKEIKNNFWDSEIWLITESINNLICKSKNILESQKRFIQDSSHELKTPLMQIDSNLEIIEEKINDEKILKKINSIKDSTQNINKIISNLWFILRNENNFSEKKEIDILKYLKIFIKNFESEAKNKNIKIILEEKEKLILKNNTYFLDRLFWNLIQNSIFYNDWNSNINIEIFGNKVKIIDKWIWIKKEDLEKIFDRFYRNENSTIYYNKWNWLWLSIVKKICDDFWWNLNVKSIFWEWSEFEIIFK